MKKALNITAKNYKDIFSKAKKALSKKPTYLFDLPCEVCGSRVIVPSEDMDKLSKIIERYTEDDPYSFKRIVKKRMTTKILCEKCSNLTTTIVHNRITMH